MKIVALLISMILFLSAFSAQCSVAQSAPYTPANGTAERNAILVGVRKYRKAPNEVYAPTRFNVQNGWAFVSSEDPKEPGVDTLAFEVLLWKTGKTWRVMDAVTHTEGSDWDTEIKRVRVRFPKSPAGIFQELRTA